MRHKRLPFLFFFIAIIVVGVIWYPIPVDLMDADPAQVSEIEIFNGNTGDSVQITDAEVITHIIENLNGVTLKRRGISFGYTGYHYRVTITLSSGAAAGRWKNFYINSESTVRKDPFFYSTTEDALIDVAYLESCFETR